MKRAIVCQGGGSKGAYTAGQIACKIKNYGYTWDEYYGTSVGALDAVMASTGDADLIKKAFTTMGNKDVWSKNPIRKNGKIKITNLLLKLIFSKESLGATNNLRKNLGKLYTRGAFEAIREHKNVVSCSVDYTSGNIAYGRNDILDYESFLDLVWASTCVPLLCAPVKYNGCYFQDGGMLMNTPIQRAINNGCEEIDVYMLNTKGEGEGVEIVNPETSGDWRAKNMIDVAGRSISLMMGHISASNILVSKLKAKNKDVTLRFHYPNESLISKPIEAMMFDKTKMTKLFYMGWDIANIDNQSDKIVIKK